MKKKRKIKRHHRKGPTMMHHKATRRAERASEECVEDVNDTVDAAEIEELNMSDAFDEDATVDQEGDQIADTFEGSFELIVIKDSENVKVHTTDTQAAVNLQVAIELAIAVILSVTILDSEQADRITQDMLGRSRVKQINQQKTIIINSRDVTVTTTDTDVAANIQILLQVLLGLIARLDIL